MWHWYGAAVANQLMNWGARLVASIPVVNTSITILSDMVVFMLNFLLVLWPFSVVKQSQNVTKKNVLLKWQRSDKQRWWCCCHGKVLGWKRSSIYSRFHRFCILLVGCVCNYINKSFCSIIKEIHKDSKMGDGSNARSFSFFKPAWCAVIIAWILDRSHLLW